MAAKLTVVFLDMERQFGHLAPTLELVRLFVRQGHAVHFFVSETFEEIVRRYGAVAWPLDATFQVDGRPAAWEVREAALSFVQRLGFDVDTQRWRRNNSRSFLPATLQLLEAGLVERVRRLEPDLIVGDALALCAHVVAHSLRLPMVASCSWKFEPPERAARPYAFLREVAALRACRARLREAVGYDFDPATLLGNYADYTIVWSTAEFDEAARADTSGRLRFFGPSFPRLLDGGTAEERLEDEDEDGRALVAELRRRRARGEDDALVYLSMGTMCGQVAPWPDTVHVIAAVVAALQDRERTTLVVAYGERFDARRLPRPCPPSVRMRARVPQKALLGVADVFISHMGNNSANEAAFMGCPVVAIPAFFDQTPNAERAVALGLGAMIPNPWAPGLPENMEHVTPHLVREKVEWVLRSEEVRRACARVKAAQRSRHHFLHHHAVDDIRRYVQSWRAAPEARSEPAAESEGQAGTCA
eukprot:scaffold3030_cov305-Prasinococcus_capsulatus_cf.AAC.5